MKKGKKLPTLAEVKTEFRKAYPKHEFEFGFHTEVGNVYRLFKDDGDINGRSTARSVAQHIYYFIGGGACG